MDVTLVARQALERWALVAALDLPSSQAFDLVDGLARIVHPATDVGQVVLLVRDGVELRWLRRLRRTAIGPSGQPTIVAVVAGDVDPAHAQRAGADAALRRVADDLLADALQEALTTASRDRTVVLPDATRQLA